VKVNVGDGLAGGWPDVGPQVEAVGAEFSQEPIPCRPGEGVQGDHLRVGQVEEVGEVAARDDERVPRRNREGVGNDERQLVAVNDPLWRDAAKGTITRLPIRS
jgi:hypothetical protein